MRGPHKYPDMPLKVMAVQMTDLVVQRVLVEKVESNERHCARRLDAIVRPVHVPRTERKVPVDQHGKAGAVTVVAVHEIGDAWILVMDAVTPADIMRCVRRQFNNCHQYDAFRYDTYCELS